MKTRQTLIEEVIKVDQESKYYEFQDDYIFNSPSYATALISGGKENEKSTVEIQR